MPSPFFVSTFFFSAIRRAYPCRSSRCNAGKGLIWRATDRGELLYKRGLTVAEVQARIAACWQPYHAAVAQAIDAAHARHGYSMPLQQPCPAPS